MKYGSETGHPRAAPERVVPELVHAQDRRAATTENGRPTQKPARVLPELRRAPPQPGGRRPKSVVSDRGQEQPEWTRARRGSATSACGERLHPHRAPLLPDERRVPVGRETRPQALERHARAPRGGGLRRPASVRRAADPGRSGRRRAGTGGAPRAGTARPSSGAPRGVGETRKARGVPRGQPIMPVHSARRSRCYGSAGSPPGRISRPTSGTTGGSPPVQVERGHHGLERAREHRLLLPPAVLRLAPPEAEARVHPELARPRRQAACRDELGPPDRQGSRPRAGVAAGPGGPRRRARGRRRPGTRASRCARRAGARGRTRGASGPGAGGRRLREAEPRRERGRPRSRPPARGPGCPACQRADRRPLGAAGAAGAASGAPAPEGEGRVGAAEPEAVRERRVDLGLPRLVRHVVEVAVRVGRLVVDRRRQDRRAGAPAR